VWVGVSLPAMKRQMNTAASIRVIWKRLRFCFLLLRDLSCVRKSCEKVFWFVYIAVRRSWFQRRCFSGCRVSKHAEMSWTLRPWSAVSLVSTLSVSQRLLMLIFSIRNVIRILTDYNGKLRTVVHYWVESSIKRHSEEAVFGIASHHMAQSGRLACEQHG